MLAATLIESAIDANCCAADPQHNLRTKVFVVLKTARESDTEAATVRRIIDGG